MSTLTKAFFASGLVTTGFGAAASASAVVAFAFAPAPLFPPMARSTRRHLDRNWNPKGLDRTTYACFRTQRLLTGFVVSLWDACGARVYEMPAAAGETGTRTHAASRWRPARAQSLSLPAKAYDAVCPSEKWSTNPTRCRLHHSEPQLICQQSNSPLQRLVGDNTFQFSDSKILDAYQITTSERWHTFRN